MSHRRTKKQKKQALQRHQFTPNRIGTGEVSSNPSVASPVLINKVEKKLPIEKDQASIEKLAYLKKDLRRTALMTLLVLVTLALLVLTQKLWLPLVFG